MKASVTIFLGACVLAGAITLAQAQSPGTKLADKQASDSPQAGNSDAQRVKKSKDGDQQRSAKAQKSFDRKLDQHAEDALEFARLHHPELAELLVRLRKTSPPEFKSAVHDLLATRDRLARLEEKFPQRYAIELEVWKLDSRIRLLAARMSMSDDPAIEADLKQALRQRVELRLRQLKEERGRLSARVERLEENIGRLETDPEAAALKDLERLKSGMASETAAKPKRKSPSAATAADAPTVKPQDN